MTDRQDAVTASSSSSKEGEGHAIPAKWLPLPVFASDAARAMLGAPPVFVQAAYPEPDDLEGWREHVVLTDAKMAEMMGAGLSDLPVDIAADHIAGVPVFRACARDVASGGNKIYLDMHGGALVYGGGDACRVMAMGTAMRVGMPVVSVDYRMPPDHPYPAGLDDCVAVYHALVEKHGAENIVIGGSSAGGHFAAATILKARDIGLPLPAGAVLLTPEVDLTEQGDSFTINLGIDTVLRDRLMPLNKLYAGSTPLDDPYVSPVFGDFTKGFPRTFLQTGTRDLFLSNTVIMHRALRRAGVEAHLHVWEAMPHGGFFGAPEDMEVAAEIQQFIAGCWG